MPSLAHLTICSLDFRYAGQLAQTQESASPVNVGGIKASSFHGDLICHLVQSLTIAYSRIQALPPSGDKTCKLFYQTVIKMYMDEPDQIVSIFRNLLKPSSKRRTRVPDGANSRTGRFYSEEDLT
jgi:hypothetical protein